MSSKFKVQSSKFQVQSLKSKVCLVTGATGVVGVPLVQMLIENGYAVRVLIRGEVKPNLFPPEVEIIPGDLGNIAALEQGTDGSQWVFHLAAKLHVNNPSADLWGEYEAINIGGTAALLAAAKKYRAEKFVFFSTINVYGAGDGGKIFDETDQINPEGFYARSKAAAEDLVLAEDFGIVLRLAAVYGSRMKGNFIRLLTALRRGRFFFIGDGQNRRTLIHQQDAARAAILIAERAAGKSVYNVTDGEIHRFSEIVGAMSAALDKKTPKLHLPLAPVRLGIGLAEDAAQTLGVKSPINRHLLEKLIEDAAVSGRKIKNELDFEPQFNLGSGWRETVNNLKL